MTNRLKITSSLLGLGLMTLGCGGGSEGGPDGGEECVGHACPDQQELFALPEGGVVTLQMVRSDRWAPEVRTHAWFAGDQTPATRPFTRPPEEWNTRDPEGSCTDVRDSNFFPTGEVESRAYLDVGDQVTLAGGGSEITLPRLLDAQDEANWNWHDVLYQAQPNPAEVALGTSYDVVIPGSSDFPETTFEEALYLPAFSAEFPNMDNTVVMPGDEDFRFVANEQDYGETDFTFLGFSDGYGPTGFCIGPAREMTVPAEFLASLPEAGNVQFGILNHQVLNSDGRRLDFIGIDCEEARYVVDDAHYIDQ